MENFQAKSPFVTGLEYQIRDDEGIPKEVEKSRMTGAAYGIYAPNKVKKKLNKVGMWNTSKIIFDNGHVEHWLNGELMTDLKDEKIGKAQGRIALQIHGGVGVKLRWKNFIFKEL